LPKEKQTPASGMNQRFYHCIKYIIKEKSCGAELGLFQVGLDEESKINTYRGACTVALPLFLAPSPSFTNLGFAITSK
jgi:hypothetical protein